MWKTFIVATVTGLLMQPADAACRCSLNENHLSKFSTFIPCSSLLWEDFKTISCSDCTYWLSSGNSPNLLFLVRLIQVCCGNASTLKTAFLTMDVACPGPDLQVVFKLRFHNTYNLQTSEVMSLMPSTEFQI